MPTPIRSRKNRKVKEQKVAAPEQIEVIKIETLTEPPKVETVAPTEVKPKKERKKKEQKKSGKATASTLSIWSKKIQEEAKKIKEKEGIPHREAVKKASANLKASGYFKK